MMAPREDDIAREALLHCALEEEVQGLRPPDLWARIATASGRVSSVMPPVEGMPPRPLARRSRLAAAAAILLGGIGVSLAIFWIDRTGGDPASTEQPADQTPADPELPSDGPGSLEEARRWLQESALVRADITPLRVWIGDRSVSIAEHPLASLFTPATRLPVDFEDDLQVVRESVLRAEPAPSNPADRRRGWEYSMGIELGAHTLQIVIKGCAGLAPERARQAPLSYAILGRNEILPIRPDASLDRMLARDLADLTQRHARDHGVVLGSVDLFGFDRRAKRLRLVDVDTSAIASLGEFAQLGFLDLRESPGLANPEGLRALTGLQALRTLQIDGSRLDLATIAQLGGLDQLDELFVHSSDATSWFDSFRQGLRGAESIDDAAIEHLVRLRSLDTLWLANPSITDRGLARLASLPDLHELLVTRCSGIRGDGFHALRSSPLRELALNGVDGLEADAILAIANLPHLEKLSIAWSGAVDPDRRLDALLALRGSRSLTGLLVDGYVAGGTRATLPDGDFARLLGALGEIPTLTTIAIRGATESLDDRAIEALRGHPKLRELLLYDCPGVSRAGADAVSATLSNGRLDIVLSAQTPR